VQLISLLPECFAYFIAEDTGRVFDASLDEKTSFVDIAECKFGEA
jgi:hypothetical protein